MPIFSENETKRLNLSLFTLWRNMAGGEFGATHS